MLCPNGTVKPFLVSLVEPVAYLKSELVGAFGVVVGRKRTALNGIGLVERLSREQARRLRCRFAPSVLP